MNVFSTFSHRLLRWIYAFLESSSNIVHHITEGSPTWAYERQLLFMFLNAAMPLTFSHHYQLNCHSCRKFWSNPIRHSSFILVRAFPLTDTTRPYLLVLSQIWPFLQSASSPWKPASICHWPSMPLQSSTHLPLTVRTAIRCDRGYVRHAAVQLALPFSPPAEILHIWRFWLTY